MKRVKVEPAYKLDEMAVVLRNVLVCPQWKESSFTLITIILRTCFAYCLRIEHPFYPVPTRYFFHGSAAPVATLLLERRAVALRFP